MNKTCEKSSEKKLYLCKTVSKSCEQKIQTLEKHLILRENLRRDSKGCPKKSVP